MKNFLTLCMLLSLGSCGIGGPGLDGKYYTHGQKVNHFIDANAAYYDDVEFKSAKTHSWKYNWFVINVDDEYYAVNMTNYAPGVTGEDLENFLDDSFENGDIREVTPTENRLNNYRDEEGNLYELTDTKTKDLEKMASLKEDLQTSFLAKKLSSEFALSESRSTKVARLISNYKKLGSKRALTDADGDIFTKSLLGHDYKTVESALMKKMSGDDSDYEKLLEKSAFINKTTPEHLNSLFETFVK